ncbi:hypothetical protein ATN84_10645 [Paramesorhizobium deserti]|uniref:Secreted protein n=1 Tax=Paramesorhizobium deserti TaxID=1494590 RepID=A0A135HTK1_9HYPH|nr:hypothetical protein [Paramesorhizobium deserti]KXF76520.1 hypothetical protein ATN84_10645 [Paramesorhizobium deserti]
MKPSSQLAVASVILLFSGGVAAAECVDTTTTAPDSTATAEIAKDGSKAPLEKQNDDAARHADTNAVQKSGQTMPLAPQHGGEDKDLAASRQDAEAQQQGDKTAAAQAQPRKDACAE